MFFRSQNPAPFLVVMLPMFLGGGGLAYAGGMVSLEPNGTCVPGFVLPFGDRLSLPIQVFPRHDPEADALIRKSQEEQRQKEENARLAELQRIKAEKEKVEREVELAREQERRQAKAEEQKAADQERKDGSAKTAELSIEKLLEKFRAEQDPVAKSFWAVSLVLLDPEGTQGSKEASDFLKDTMGWQESDFSNLLKR